MIRIYNFAKLLLSISMLMVFITETRSQDKKYSFSKAFELKVYDKRERMHKHPPQAMLEKYVERELNKWEEKSEFETYKDFKLRVNDSTRTLKKSEVIDLALKDIAEICKKNYNKYGFKMGSYSAHSQKYDIYFPWFKPLIIHVPRKNARSFKQNKSKLRITELSFAWTNNEMVFDSLTIVNPADNFKLKYKHSYVHHSTIFQIKNDTTHVSNINVRQIEESVIINYDLKSETNQIVSVYVSDDGGDYFSRIPLMYVEGDVGEVSPGKSKKISWKPLYEGYECYSKYYVFKIETYNPFGEFADRRDKRKYKTVTIGSQVWMAENLAYMPKNAYSNKWDSCYNVMGYEGRKVKEAKRTAEYKEYGVLYNYKVAQDVCPNGWRLPTMDDWLELEKTLDFYSTKPKRENYSNNFVGMKMKKSGAWNSYRAEGQGNNLSGFGAKAGGFSSYFYDGRGISFGNVKSSGYWWSTGIEYDRAFKNYKGNTVVLFNTMDRLFKTSKDVKNGQSVRCIEDNGSDSR